MRRAIVVIGKAPRAGRVKTRLVPPLDSEVATRLYAAFLQDTMQTCLTLGWERTTLIHPRGDRRTLRSLLPGAVELLEQPGAGLTDALQHAFAHHFNFEDDFQKVILVGSDSPTLPAEAIVKAEATLRTERDLALGRTADGGYYLVGMRAPHPGVFEGIEWSTPRVYRQTVERAHELGLVVHPATEWYDVDEPADLARLQRELAAAPDAVAAQTRGVLGGTSTAGVLPERSAYVAATASPISRP